MKALVLCGGIPQAELIKQLKERGIEAILADMNEKAPAVAVADKFYPVSTLDVEGIKSVAVKENVDFLITVCADQMILVVAQISEMLGLPCYITYETAQKVSSKELMKQVFVEHGVPTSKNVVMGVLDKNKISGLRYPLIVKPVDSYSSRGVNKVLEENQLQAAFDEAIRVSRTNTAIVEEFVEGQELTVDVYVEDGKAKVLCASLLDKIPGNGKFVIQRCTCPAIISDKISNMINETCQKIADAFNLKNTPMLVQLITDGERISVVEFCARTGGGDKFRLIKQMTGFDVVTAVLDLTMGKKPHVEVEKANQYVVDEFLYCKSGTFDHLEGFKELEEAGIINEYYQLKGSGVEVGNVSSSGDRVAYFTIIDKNYEDLLKRHETANAKIKAVSVDGEDLFRHELIANIR
jgi:biotin carboxylase